MEYLGRLMSKNSLSDILIFQINGVTRPAIHYFLNHTVCYVDESCNFFFPVVKWSANDVCCNLTFPFFG